MTIAFPFDPNSDDFGTDVYLLDDLAAVWGLAAGDVNYSLAQARRLTQRTGSMDFYDQGYLCLDIRGYLSAKLGTADISRLKGRITAAMENDPRTLSCGVDLQFDFGTNTMAIALQLETAQGPFALVLQASTLSVELLSINGVTTDQLPAVATLSPGIVIVQGGGAAPGPPGPPGPGGGASLTLDYGDGGASDASGAEFVAIQLQREVNLSALPGTITLELVARALSDAGTATFRVRLGGSDGAVDGTVRATLTASSPSMTQNSATSTFANPGGILHLKITIESSGAAVNAAIQGMTLTIR